MARTSSRRLPRLRTALHLGLSLAALVACAEADRGGPGEAVHEMPTVNAAMRAAVERHEVAGAVTLVIGPDRPLHLSAVGLSDLAAGTALKTDAMFWIASMTKPITATAVMMLQEEGLLSVEDPVSKYLPEFAGIKTADGTPAVITLHHLLTHTSGLAEVSNDEGRNAHTLADLIPLFVHKPLQFAPGSKWQYCQTGINSLGRIIEVVASTSYPEFLQKRLFSPLGMVDTTFTPTAAQQLRLAMPYQLKDGQLTVSKLPPPFDPTISGRVPMANGGLFSTAYDYGRFCQLILNHGTLDGHHYLSPASVSAMTSVQSGDLATGFTPGNGWGFGWCVVRHPQGVSAALSPGSFGHGGAFGTQVWIDPVKNIAEVLLVQRSNFPNSDGSDIRRDFHNAVAADLGK